MKIGDRVVKRYVKKTQKTRSYDDELVVMKVVEIKENGDYVLSFPNPQSTITVPEKEIKARWLWVDQETLKYAISVPLDQTVGYLLEDGNYTISHKEVKLFDSVKDASDFAAKYPDYWDEEFKYSVEWLFEVANEDEFRSRMDTW